jgi:hypothetical protein
MVLRLILVSFVAGLGVTPPAESELAGWSQTARTWLDARLAEWNAFDLLDEDSVPLAPAAVPGPSFDFDFAVLEDDLASIFAAEPPAAAPAPTPAADAPSDEDRAFAVVVDEMVAEFFQELSPTPQVEAPRAVVVEIEIEVLETEIAGAELDTGAPTNVPAPNAMATLPSGEDEYFELVEDFDLAPAPAVALSRAPDDTGAAPPAPADEDARTPDQPEAGSPLRDAVRLTRDAVFAWINLLQSPALISVSD